MRFAAWNLELLLSFELRALKLFSGSSEFIRENSCHSCQPQFVSVNETDWEARYQSGDMPWEHGDASPGLVDFLGAHPELAKGTVCVSGCGSGHDARAWAKAGFETFGYDLAPSAIRLCQERTAGAGLSAKFQLADRKSVV